MSKVVDIPLPLAHIGSVNAWLLRGDPLTLLDTGPRDDAALAALEAGLRREGLRIEDIELVLATHHHLDHRRPGRDDQAPVRRGRRRARPGRGLRGALPRRGRARPPVRARAHGPPRRPRPRHRRPRGLLDVPAQPLRGRPCRRPARRRRPHRRGRPDAARGVAPGPQHDRHALRRRRRAHRVHRRPPPRADLLEHGDPRDRPRGRRAGAVALALPRRPPAHGPDAARTGCSPATARR